MDTVTHGLVGALIGKAFFRERATPGKHDPSAARDLSADAQAGRVALWAATLGAVFPDADIVFELFDPNDLALIELHRGFTHSFLCLPFFAAGLAGLTRSLARRWRIACPSWSALAGIYAVGLASHIVLDLITSFGTMIWSPLRNTRVAWDLAFILDFTMTGLVLLPQMAAWAYRPEAGSPAAAGRRARRLCAWAFFSLAAAGIVRLAHAAGFPVSPWVAVAVSLLAAAIFCLPARYGWGFRATPAAWCRAGVYGLALYLGLCAVAHHIALVPVRAFAHAHALAVENLGALPMPPSLLHWTGLIRTPQGVYTASFTLIDLARSRSGPASQPESGQPAPAGEPRFRFFPDAPTNSYIEAARREPAAQAYLWFARFPVIRYFQQGDLHTVEFTDLRFFTRGLRRRNPFTFRVTLDSAGRVLAEGWAD